MKERQAGKERGKTRSGGGGAGVERPFEGGRGGHGRGRLQIRNSAGVMINTHEAGGGRRCGMRSEGDEGRQRVGEKRDHM